MKFKKYSKLLESKNDLFKCYITIKDNSEQKYITKKEYAANKYFIKISEKNIDSIKLDKSLPILTYNKDITKKLIDKGFDLNNIYNLPKDIDNSSSKEQFHKLVGEDVNLPKTTYDKKTAKSIGFPLIAKPSKGHSGVGIKIFKNESEFDNADHSKYDIYSQYIDKLEEHRFINLRGKPIVWLERKPLNNKAKDGDGDSGDAMMFKYIKRNIKDIPEHILSVLEKYCDILSSLPYICFDLMIDKNKNVYIIEANSQPGVPFDSTVEIYKSIFEDFYGRPVNKESEELLSRYSDKLITTTINSDPDRFEVS